MTWHLLTSTYFDFDRIAADNRADRVPEHLVPLVADDLAARLHQPVPADETVKPLVRDRIGSLIYGSPAHWELARRVVAQLEPGDMVYATGCDAGVPLGILCALRARRRTPLALNMLDPGRVRSIAAGWLLGLVLAKVLLIVPTKQQAEAVRSSFGRRFVDVVALGGPTDYGFFRPPDRQAQNDRPLVVSCGAEQRDYALLADSLADTDVEVRVCLASPNLTDGTRYTMPDPIPSNFEFRYFAFDELRDLYQQADLVVIPLLENRYSAGLTSMFEAIACGAPVVTMESVGTIDELIDKKLVVGVPPGDEAALRQAIDKDLANPDEARIRAMAARDYLIKNFSSDRFRQILRGWLAGLATGSQVTTPSTESF